MTLFPYRLGSPSKTTGHVCPAIVRRLGKLLWMKRIGFVLLVLELTTPSLAQSAPQENDQDPEAKEEQAEHLFTIGKYKEAIEIELNILKAREKSPGPDNTNTATSLNVLERVLKMANSQS